MDLANAVTEEDWRRGFRRRLDRTVYGLERITEFPDDVWWMNKDP